MGEYIYRRTSRVSNIQLPNGDHVQAVHIKYAYKPYSNWDGEAHNRRMRRTALAAVGNANRSLHQRSFDPSGFKFAVTEDSQGKIEGGTILKWSTNVPQLISDYWEKHVVGNMPEPCAECGALIRKPIEHPVCLEAQVTKSRARNAQYTADMEAKIAARRAELLEQSTSNFSI